MVWSEPAGEPQEPESSPVLGPFRWVSPRVQSKQAVWVLMREQLVQRRRLVWAPLVMQVQSVLRSMPLVSASMTASMTVSMTVSVLASVLVLALASVLVLASMTVSVLRSMPLVSVSPPR